MSALRILVVDDAVAYRRILSELVESLPDAELVGAASRGALALGKMRETAVDLVLLDFEMPDMNGLETLREIRRLYPDTSIIMISGENAQSAALAADARGLGAIDFILKPDTADADSSRRQLGEKLQTLLSTVRIRRNLRSGGVASPAAPEPSAKLAMASTSSPVALAEPVGPRVVPARIFRRPGRVDVVAIGVSTGGPNALLTLIPNLPADLGVPVLIVQHMPPSFTAALAEDLNKKSAITVREAVEGEPILPNVVLLAPGGYHMVIRSRTNAAAGRPDRLVGLTNTPPENSCRPSVDVLFRSVAEQYGGNILAVVMTGMGNDGCAGVREMKLKGCYCITQSEQTCVVYGMPLAVDEAGLSDESVPLDLIANRIRSAVKGDFSR